MNQDYITKESLNEIGVTLSDPTHEAELLKHANDTLAERIGEEVASSLDDDKFNEMMEIEQSGDTAKLGDWIVANVPDLQQIAQDEMDILLGELADNYDKLG